MLTEAGQRTAQPTAEGLAHTQQAQRPCCAQGHRTAQGRTCVIRHLDMVGNPTFIIEKVSLLLETYFQATFHLQGA